jgi:protein gp37
VADGSRIEWTDATWNIVTGCSVVSPGCTNCYAMKLAGTRLKHHFSRKGLTVDTKAGPVWTGETRVNWEWIDQPLEWARPRQIFVCAHGDLFHASVGWEDIALIYGVMIAAHHLRGHILQVLTKRADRMRELLQRQAFWELANASAGAEIMTRVDPLNRRSDDARATCDDYGPGNPPPGIWLGTSAEDQQRADERVPHLLATPAAVRFVSAEPLLGEIDFLGIRISEYVSLNALTGSHLDELGERDKCGPKLDWVIVGGENGPRPMHPDWARSVRDQCAAAGVPFFFKQWGEWRPKTLEDGDRGLHQWVSPPDAPRFGSYTAADALMVRLGKGKAGRLLDGATHDAMPAHG